MTRNFRAGISRFAILAAIAALPGVAHADSFTIPPDDGTTARTVTGSDQGFVGEGATLSLSGTAVTWSSTAAGTVVIDNHGTIESTGSRAIDSGNSGFSSSYSIVINNFEGAAISGSDDAIRIRPNAAGTITLNNDGTVVSTTGQALDFNNAPSGTVFINNNETGILRALNADGVRPGSAGTVTNYGLIEGFQTDPDDSNDGIDFQDFGGTVYNLTAADGTGGIIEGARHGITGDGTLTITNEAGARIVGHNGSGINGDGGGTVTNYGTISGNVNAAAEEGDGDGVDIDQAGTVTNYGRIEANGAVGDKDGNPADPNIADGIAIGGGTITNYSGAVITSVGRGIIVDDSEGEAAFAPVTITNYGLITSTLDGITLTGDQADVITNGGAIRSATGAAILMGGGADTLNLLAGYEILGAVDGGEGTDTLTLDGGDDSFGGADGFELLEVLGGTWTLTGSQSYSDGTTVAGGATLDAAGTLDSAVTVEDGGYVEGTGTIGSLLLESGGAVGPGNSIGTLHIVDNLSFSATSFLDVETDAFGNSDRIEVTGGASLTGGVVRVLSAPGQVDPTATYTILTTTGYKGTFDGVGSGFVFLTPELHYGATDVTLTFERSDVPFALFAGSPNQQAVADVLDDGALGDPIVDAIAQVGPAALGDALDALSGEIHADVAGALVEDSRFVREAIFRRLGEAGPADGTTFWARAYGSSGRWDGEDGAAAFDRSIGGGFVGVDAPLAEGWRFGALVGYARSEVDADDRDGTATVDTYQLAAYAGTRFDAVALRFGAAYAWHDVETERGVAFPGFAEQLDADYSARTGQLFAEVGYGITAGSAQIEPFAGLAWVHLDRDGFTEAGGDAGLEGGSESWDTGFSTLGVRVATDVPFADGTLLSLRGSVAWQHAFGDDAPETVLAFDGSDGFTVAGAPIARDALLLTIGAGVALSPSATLAIDYSGRIGDGVSDHGATLDLRVAF